MKARRTLCLAILAALFVRGTHAQTLTLSFSDPVGDHSGIVDVTDMTMTFDRSTGNYEIVLTATPTSPFNGSFRVNINLFNPDTGTTARDPAFFQEVLNDFNLMAPATMLSLSGGNTRLKQWDAGDRVATSTTSLLGNPDESSEFRSSVSNFPFTGCGTARGCDEDAIAFEDIELIAGPLERHLGGLIEFSNVAKKRRVRVRQPVALCAGQSVPDVAFLTRGLILPPPGKRTSVQMIVRQADTGTVLVRRKRRVGRDDGFWDFLLQLSPILETADLELDLKFGGKGKFQPGVLIDYTQGWTPAIDHCEPGPTLLAPTEGGPMEFLEQFVGRVETLSTPKRKTKVRFRDRMILPPAPFGQDPHVLQFFTSGTIEPPPETRTTVRLTIREDISGRIVARGKFRVEPEDGSWDFLAGDPFGLLTESTVLRTDLEFGGKGRFVQKFPSPRRIAFRIGFR